VMLAVRHMETRILDRVEELAAQIDEVSKRFDATEKEAAPAPRPTSAERPASWKPRKRQRKEPSAALAIVAVTRGPSGRSRFSPKACPMPAVWRNCHRFTTGRNA
jgi:hypothetical protein